MSAFRGRERNKGALRRNAKAMEYIKKLIARQDKELIKQLENHGNQINRETESTTSNL